MNIAGAYEVQPYSIDALTGLFAALSNTPIDVVEAKDHIAYFDEYFCECCAATVVIENDYVDHDYLEDYAVYYSKCFHPYRRFCTRLHFFSVKFGPQEFRDVVLNANHQLASEIRDAYLGFVVVKPLPDNFIGRTCLQTYPQNGRRHYPALRRYEVHLFGLCLTVNSIAFQEQDSTVALCATSALWSAFHGTGKLWHHPILSPVEITQAATLNSDDPMRSLPNDGLTLEQMARAIRAVSLEPYMVDVQKHHELQTTVYAYLKGKIPLLLDFCLIDTEADKADAETNSDETLAKITTVSGAMMGSHAVAIVGFSLGAAQPTPLEGSGTLLTATRIDKLYAHDDQVGPYARMELTDNNMLTTSWRGEFSGNIGNVLADPCNVLVPLYNKVRVPFSLIHDTMMGFDTVVEDLRATETLSFEQRLEWDIHLATSNILKEEIRGVTDLDAEDRETLLLTGMPRFVWRATGVCGDRRIVDVLFDATDITSGTIFLRTIDYNDELVQVLHSIVKGHDENTNSWDHPRVVAILDSYRAKTPVQD